ncbi:MAG TPA: SMP-30/gluconolactonase/LRE family protein [Polyangiaceae bacterium]|nr:SMP-30/gluconolactonase/LRE family protein [Polyangiaceae bacterium]
MQSDFEILHPRFSSLLLGNCRLEKLYTGTRWAEGPCYFADGNFLIWSDIPNNRMLRWTEGLGVEVFRQPANCSNGNTRDRQGRLVSCEHLTRRVTRTEWDGSITVLAERYEGRRLNSPNDVVVKSDGSIWFTDPPYGILSDYEGKKSASELNGNFVFRWDPATGGLSIVADEFDKPNGIAFTPDERQLFVADSGRPHHMKVFDVKEDGKGLSTGRVFAECDAGIYDGFRFDTDGNLWTSTRAGVTCYAPDGTMLGKIRIPEAVSNLTFGGPKRNRLFITATTSLYSLFVNANGVQSP